MNAYLKKMISQVELPLVRDEEVSFFRSKVIEEMKKMGATESQIDLLQDGSVKYAIINKKKPEELAWVILQ